MAKTTFIVMFLVIGLAANIICLAGDEPVSDDQAIVLDGPRDSRLEVYSPAGATPVLRPHDPIRCENLMMAPDDGLYIGAMGPFLRRDENRQVSIGLKGDRIGTGRYKGFKPVLSTDGRYVGQWGLVLEGAVIPASLPGASPDRIATVGLETIIPLNEITWVKDTRHKLELFYENWLPRSNASVEERGNISIHNELMRNLNLFRAQNLIDSKIKMQDPPNGLNDAAKLPYDIEFYKLGAAVAGPILIHALTRGHVFNVHGQWDYHAQQALSANSLRHFPSQWSYYRSLFAPSPLDMEFLLNAFYRKLDGFMRASKSREQDYSIAFWAQQMIIELQPAQAENNFIAQAFMNYVMVRSAFLRGKLGVILDFTSPAVTQATIQFRESDKVTQLRPFQSDLQNYIVRQRVSESGTFTTFSRRRLQIINANGGTRQTYIDGTTNPTEKFLYAYDSTLGEERALESSPPASPSSNRFAISFNVGRYLNSENRNDVALLNHPGWDTIRSYYVEAIRTATLEGLSQDPYIVAGRRWLLHHFVDLISTGCAATARIRLP